MSLATDSCICLRKLDYSETSQILLLFSRQHGLVRVIAKGAHRTTKAGASRFGGGLDVLEVGEAVFTDRPEKNLATLTEWRLSEGHLALRSGLRPMYLGLYAAELVSLLIEEHDPHPELFDLLERTLHELGSPRTEEAFLAFELDLLRQCGYLPQLGQCVACGQRLIDRGPVFFLASRGGTLCRNCESAWPDRLAMDRRLLDLMVYLLRLRRDDGAATRLPRLTRHQTDPLNRLLAEHIHHTLGRPLRLLRYVLGWDPTPAPAAV